jgi:hypothetical protein
MPDETPESIKLRDAIAHYILTDFKVDACIDPTQASYAAIDILELVSKAIGVDFPELFQP